MLTEKKTYWLEGRKEEKREKKEEEEWWGRGEDEKVILTFSSLKFFIN